MNRVEKDAFAMKPVEVSIDGSIAHVAFNRAAKRNATYPEKLMPTMTALSPGALRSKWSSNARRYSYEWGVKRRRFSPTPGKSATTTA